MEIWINPNLESREFVKKWKSLDLLVSDLDKAVTGNQALLVILRKLIRQPYQVFNPKIWDATLTYIARGQSNAWKKFDGYFLNIKEKGKIKKKYTKEYAERKLYPGFKNFLSLLPNDTVEVFLTRNIDEVVCAYLKATGFDDALTENFDKEEGIKQLVEKYPGRKRMAMIGDSPEDEVVHNYFAWLLKKNKIEYYCTVNVGSINEKCDISLIKPNFNPLVEFIISNGYNIK